MKQFLAAIYYAPVWEQRQGQSIVEAEIEFFYALQELATSYRRWRRQPPSNKSEARYQLQYLAQLAAGFDTASDADREKLLAHIHPSNETASTALWAALMRHARWPKEELYPFAWLQSERVDWTLLSEAAADAASSLQTRGDYRDPNLALAIQLLVDMFTKYTRKKPILNRPQDYPTPVYELAKYFFSVVDPKLDWDRIYTSLYQLRRARNRRAQRANLSSQLFQSR